MSSTSWGHQRVLVTGGSGFIGTNVVSALLNDGIDVLSIDIAEPKHPDHRSVWLPVDILDRQRLVGAFVAFRPDLLIHLAARTDLDEKRDLAGYAANMSGVENVICAVEEAGSVERSLFASSRLVCRIGYTPKGVDDVCPTTLYGESKVRGERLVRAASSRLGAWTLLRFTSIWGPWFGTPYNQYFKWIERGVYVHQRGIDPAKSFGFVGNTVHQLMSLSAAPAPRIAGRTLWISDYPPLRVREWSSMIAERLRAKPVREAPLSVLRVAALLGDLIEVFPRVHAPLTSFRLNNLLTDMVYDTSELEEIVGPLPWSLQDGVEQTVEWLRGTNNEGSSRWA